MKYTLYPARINLSNYTQNGLIKLLGPASSNLGIDFIKLGDINQDGNDDVALSATGLPNGGVLIVLGSHDLGESNRLVNLSSFNNSQVIRINGEQPAELTGFSLGSGDLNGDGVKELIIGTYKSNGKVFVIYGGKHLIAGQTINLASLNGTYGFKIYSELQNDFFGMEVTSGDLNQDGFDELVAGANTAFSSKGSASIFWGHPQIGRSGFLNISSLKYNNSLMSLITGANAGDKCGTGLKIGDLNGDGVNDLVVGSYSGGTRSLGGSTEVLFGKKSGLGNIDLSVAPTAARGFRVVGAATNDLSGFCVDVGDLNQDNRNDLYVSAFNSAYGGSVGTFHAVFASTAGAIMDLASVSQAIRFVGESAGSYFGVALGTTSDLNGDGYPDVFAGAKYFGSGQPGAGYMFFSDPTMNASSLFNVASLNGTNGIRFYGEAAGDNAGISVGDVGDLNCDGLPDAMICAPGNTAGAGACYVIPGRSPLTFTQNSLTITEGQTVILSWGDLAAVHINPSVGGLYFYPQQVIRGWFGRVLEPGISVTNFSAAELNSSLISFTQNASNDAPSYRMTVTSNDGLKTGPVSAKISFTAVNDAPTLQLAPISLNQGSRIIFTQASLNVLDEESKPEQLNIVVSSTQYGQFEFLNQPGVGVTQFTQPDVNSGQVCFVTDGSVSAPTFSIYVTDGQANSPIQQAVITFNALPFVQKNEFLLNEGESSLISRNALVGADPDDADDQLVYRILPTPQNIQFVHYATNQTWLNFTQQDVNNTIIRLILSGSVAPSFNFTLSDGKVTLPPLAAVVNFNHRPQITAATLPNLSQGDTVNITTAHLDAIDPDGDVLQFEISDEVGGYFAQNNATSVPLSQFFVHHVRDKIIVFVQDNSVQPPSFTVRLFDGRMRVGPVASQPGLFNRRPVVEVCRMQLNQGQTMTLTVNDLYASDYEGNNDALKFLISYLKHGQFRRAGAAVTSFTQKEVIEGRISFAHDNSLSEPDFDLRVTDGLVESMQPTCGITYSNANRPPEFVRLGLKITEGQQKVITPDDMWAADADNNNGSLVLIMTNILHGMFIYNSTSINNLLQQRILSGQILFQHDKASQKAPSFDVAVTDGSAVTGPITVPIDYTPVDDPPILTKNRLIGRASELNVDMEPYLAAYDPDTPDANLIYIVQVLNGYFVWLVTGMVTNNFTQKMLSDSEIAFNFKSIPPLLNVSVCDLLTCTPFAPAQIEFDPTPQTSIKVGLDMKDILLKALIAPAIGLFVYIIRRYATCKIEEQRERILRGDVETESAKTENEAKVFNKEVVEIVGREIMNNIKTTGIFTCPDVMKSCAYRNAIIVIMRTISKRGIDMNLNRYLDPLESAHILALVGIHTKAVTKKTTCRYFDAIVTPDDLIEAAPKIAAAIANAMNADKPAVEMVEIPPPPPLVEDDGSDLLYR